MSCLLTVDDEPFNLLIIEEFLGGANQLVTAGNGLEAWQLCVEFGRMRAFG